MTHLRIWNKITFIIGANVWINFRKGDASGDSSTDSKTHSSSSESESSNADAVSFNSEDLESMFENTENVDIGDFTEPGAGEEANDFV